MGEKTVWYKVMEKHGKKYVGLILDYILCSRSH
jgi:hypothetical protein